MKTVTTGTTTIDFGHNRSFANHEDYSMHCHNSYEVYYFVSGDVSYIVEGRHYTPTPHSILMISPNILHGVKATPPHAYERYTLHFSAHIIPVENRSALLSPFINQPLNQIFIIKMSRHLNYNITSRVY